jgi:hypothetical protein
MKNQIGYQMAMDKYYVETKVKFVDPEITRKHKMLSETKARIERDRKLQEEAEMLGELKWVEID